MHIYHTDGSCEPNPGKGGFAVIKNMKPWVLGREEESTNIRMEGKAIIAAMRDAKGEPATIHTDSEFWINVITKWAPGWEARGWKKKNGDIKNLDIVQEASALFKDSETTLVWVRGHNNDPGNELADEWANRARRGEDAPHGPLDNRHIALAVPYRHADDGLEFLVVKRVPEDGHFWQPITGGIEAGETTRHTIQREMHEEAGIADPLHISDELARMVWEADDEEGIDVLHAVEVHKDDNVQLNPAEHEAHYWLPLKPAIDLLRYENNKYALQLVHDYAAKRRAGSQ